VTRSPRPAPTDIPSPQGIKATDRLAKATTLGVPGRREGDSLAAAAANSQGSEFDEDEPEALPFGGPLPPGAPCPLKNALWSCTQAFIRGKSSAPATKRVFLFTNDDAPLAGDEQDRAVQVARDAAESGVEVQLFGMARPGRTFDPGRFFTRILVVDDEEAAQSGRILDSGDLVARLCTALHRKVHRKRVLSRLPLVLAAPPTTAGGGAASQSQATGGSDGSGCSVDDDLASLPTVSIQMQLYMVTAPTKVASIMLDGTCNERIEPQTKMICNVTGSFLDEYDVRTYQEVGGHSERAYLTKGEMTAMKSWGTAPGIVVLGFVATSWLKPWYQLRPPYFLYPDEPKVKGSTVAAAALLKSMTARGVVALARFVRTASSGPQLLALLPQPEELSGADGSQLTPPGFKAIVLPFADDLRDLPRPPASVMWCKPEPGDDSDGGGGGGGGAGLPPALVAAATSLAGGSVTLDRGKLTSIHNPVLQKQYAMLQALALDEDTGSGGGGGGSWSEARDDDLPPDAGLWAGFADKVDAFLALLPEDAVKEKGKRKAPAASAAPKATKKAKASGDDDDDDAPQLDWAAMHAAGEVPKQTVPSLKAFLKSRGLPVSGKKADLVDRALGALE